MTRTIKIRDILAFPKAQFDIEPGPTLVTGANSSGKTSFARILATLLTHHNNPAGLPPKDIKSYLHGNQSEGLAEISDGAKWNGAKIAVPEGMKPEATWHSAGLVSFVPTSGMNERSRAKIFELLFLPSDPEEILRPHWVGKKGKAGEEMFLHIIETIKNEGWEATEKSYGDHKRSEKRKWHDETGVNYGASVANEWRPEAWESDLENASDADLDAEVSTAQSELDAITQKVVVSERDIEEAEQLREETLPPLRDRESELKKSLQAENEKLEDWRDQGEQARGTLEKHKAELSTLTNRRDDLANEKAPEKPDTCQCPKCKAVLIVDGRKVIEYDPENYKAPDNSALVKEIEKDIKPAEGLVAEWTETVKEIGEKWKAQNGVCKEIEAELNQVLGQIKSAEERIERFAGKTATSDRDEAEQSAKEQNLVRAKERRAVARQYRTASLIHDNIVEYEWIEKLLSPTGARASHMKEPMEQVNTRLERVCEIAGWDPIRVSESYEIYSGGRIARLTAENEQRKVQWATQIALGLLLRDDWIILDAADLLRGRHWEGLVKVVDKLKEKTPNKYVVVCATETEAPDGWAKIALGEG